MLYITTDVFTQNSQIFNVHKYIMECEKLGYTTKKTPIDEKGRETDKTS